MKKHRIFAIVMVSILLALIPSIALAYEAKTSALEFMCGYSATLTELGLEPYMDPRTSGLDKYFDFSYDVNPATFMAEIDDMALFIDPRQLAINTIVITPSIIDSDTNERIYAAIDAFRPDDPDITQKFAANKLSSADTILDDVAEYTEESPLMWGEYAIYQYNDDIITIELTVPIPADAV